MSVRTLSPHTISIEENTGAPDGMGGVPESWETCEVGVAARIRPTSASERQNWLGRPTVASHVIYISDTGIEIDETKRIIYGTRIFNVLGVRNIDEVNRFLTVDAEEVR